MTAIWHALANVPNQKLTTISVADNPITAPAARAIGTGLIANKSLLHVDIAALHIGDAVRTRAWVTRVCVPSLSPYPGCVSRGVMWAGCWGCLLCSFNN